MDTCQNNNPSSNRIGRNMLLGIIGGVLFGFLMLYLRTHAGASALWRWLDFCLFQDITQKNAPRALGIFYIGGQLFIRIFQLIIIPLVFTSLVIAICGIRDSQQLKRISCRTIIWFMCTTLFAELLCGIVCWCCCQLDIFPNCGTEICKMGASTGSNPMLLFLNIVPFNILTAFCNNQEIIAVAFLAIIFALTMRKRESENMLLHFCKEVNHLVMDVLDFLVKYIAPTAIFMLLSRSIASYGIHMLAQVARYIIVCVGLLLAYLLLFYPILIHMLIGMSPLKFLKTIWKVMILTYSTSCSAVSLPLNIRTAIDDLKVKPEVASFVLPLGLTINMDGTAILMTVASFFIASCGGYQIGAVGFLMIMLVSLIGSIGTPAAPGAGGILLLSVVTSIGVNNDAALAAYSIVLAVSRPIEMVVATLNAVGDTVVAVAVSKSLESSADKEPASPRM